MELQIEIKASAEGNRHHFRVRSLLKFLSINILKRGIFTTINIFRIFYFYGKYYFIIFYNIKKKSQAMK